MRKKTIEEVINFIKTRHPGAICNFTEYKNSHTKLDLVCEKGHIFKINYHDIYEGIWCSDCGGTKKLTIEYVKNEIEKKHPGTICDFSIYKNAQTKLDLICEKGHKFKINYGNIRQNWWCAECSGNKKHTIEYVKQQIKEKYPKAICNSFDYKNNNTKLDLICENGHAFKISYHSIINGYWCAECAGVKKYTIEYVKDFINRMHPDTICNFTEYKSNSSKLDLTCNKGHNFKLSFSKIKNKVWCAECAGVKKYTVEQIKQYVDNLHPGAICNFNEYKDNKTKLCLVCENGHPFKIRFVNIQQGVWCSQCSEYKSEKYIRSIFEKLTGKEFLKIRPSWLISDKTNYQLELDGFNEEIKIAFECQGLQHYKFQKKFHKTKETFEYQLYKDELKKKLCEENGVRLICIPAIDVMVDGIKYTKEYIEKEIKLQLLTYLKT